jgi:hypothetical protein
MRYATAVFLGCAWMLCTEFSGYAGEPNKGT